MEDFTITTKNGKYSCRYSEVTTEEKKDIAWEVSFELTNKVKGIYYLPCWARTRVFQFIDSIDKEVV